MKKILFVCLGNICRSPMAEAIFNHKIEKMGLSTYFNADSAGTADYHVGEDPDLRTIKTVKKNNIPIRHKGQQFKKHHAEIFDYLIAMDQSNRHNMLLEMNGDNADQVMLIRDFDPQERAKDVPDPWYGGMEGFDEVFDILDRCIEELITYLKRRHSV